MRILQVITSMLTGGAEKLIVDMAPIMRSQGHVVDIMLFNGTDTPFKQQLIDEGFNVISLSEGEGASFYNPKYVLKLVKYLPKYDVVHTHNSICQYYVAMASMLCRKKPRLITTEHNTSNRRRGSRLFALVDRWMYGKYNRIAAISDKAKENLIDFLGCSDDNVDVIYNGINLDVYKTPTDLVLRQNPDQVVVTMVAAFRPQKDQKTLIDAIALLPERFHLFLAGTGEKLEDCKQYVNDKGLEARVTFLGNRNDIPDVLKASDIVVLSSHYEGLSLSSIEGLASGRPFVASDVDGLHEVVDGAGVLFEEGNKEQLAEIIKRLSSNEEERNNVVGKCMARASQYDIDKTANRYLQIYV